MKHLSLRRAKRAGSLLAFAALSLAIPAGASADIPIAKFKAGPVAPFNLVSGLPVTSGNATPAANDFGCMHINPNGPVLSTGVGGSTDYCISFNVTPGDAITGEDINNTLVGLPVGSLAAIDLAAKCTEEQFGREASTPQTCPGTSQVGTALAQLQTPAAPNPAVDRAVAQSPGRIYALDTPGDKAAKFGVALIASSPTPAAPTTPVTETKFTITVSQLGDAATGLQNQTDTLSKTVASAAFPGGRAPIAIQATSLRFWGSAAAHPHVANPFAPTAPVTMAADFFRVGTTCGTTQVATLTVNPYTDTPTNAASKPSTATTDYKLTGCENLPFAPTFTAGISGETTAGGHPALSVKITSPEGDEDLGATQITLPSNISTDTSRIQAPCLAATFFADACTDATIIGTVKATLSGINADVVTGVVHQVRIAGENLPALGFDFNGRLPLRIAGNTKIDATGRVVNTFSNLPSIPQRSLDIELYGGAKGILQVSGGKCQQSGYDAILTGQNAKQKSFSIRTTCPEQLTARLEKAESQRPNLIIGGSGATGKKISTFRVTLPPGLTINKNKSQSGIKFDKFETGVTGEGKRSRLSKKTIRFTVPKPGSNGLRVLTKTGTLGASKKFADRSDAITLDVRIVYTDGSKANVKVPITRKQ